MTDQYICPKSGVVVPAELVATLADRSAVVPNTWNPNRMDAFMREKLRRGITKDGFLVPVVVRPIEVSMRPDKADLIAAGVKWEIVDGEHRFKEGGELGMEKIPIANAGPISDASAKAITVKINATRGEFDSVELAEMVKGLVDENGLQALVDELPFTAERVQAMVDLLNVDVSTVSFPAPRGDDEKDEDGDGDAGGGFSPLDPSTMKLAHKCPRCAFEFNDPKKT